MQSEKRKWKLGRHAMVAAISAGAGARACTERPQPALARAFGADWCPSRTVQRTRALRATHALAQSSAQRQRERARPPG